jgi:hypothetical protein
VDLCINWHILKEKQLEDAWTYHVDNSFTLGLFKQLNGSTTLPQPPSSPQLCQRCSNTHIFPLHSELLFNLSELRKTAESCELCNIFHQFLKPPDRSDQNHIEVYRDGSSLKIDSHNRPILRICADLGQWIYSAPHF